MFFARSDRYASLAFVIFAGFGLALVASPASIKLLMFGAICYAVVRMSAAFWRA